VSETYIARAPRDAVCREAREPGVRERGEHARGVPEIYIGVREFKCIGVSPPQDHPHIYIDMGEVDTILFPYCGTRFRFGPRLTPLEVDPPDSYFADNNAA